MGIPPAPPPPHPCPSTLLHYNPHYRVLLCTTCHYAIQPTGLTRHLKEIHQIKRYARRPYIQYASKYILAAPEDVFRMQEDMQGFPVEGLKIMEGLRCEEEGCGHLCVSEKRMRSHWVAKHRRQGDGKGGDWREVRLQTFFRGNLVRYFTGPEAIGEKKMSKQQVIHCDLLGESNLTKKTPSSLRDVIPQELSVKEINISSTLNENDSFLLHHYITHTAPTLATDPTTLILWQQTAPLLAQFHPFLLHGLLALSALHLAHLTPTTSPLHSEYLLSATTHQDTAMPTFRSSIASVTTEICHAVFTFSHLLVLYCFASESQDERLLVVSPTGDPCPIWLHFLRIGCELMCHVWDDLEVGPVKGLVAAWDIPEFQDANEGRTSLVERLLSFIPSKESEDFWTEEEEKIYTETAILLGQAFACGAEGISYSTWDALRIWPVHISTEFLEILRNQQPGALILLAHYCVLLKRVEGNWYFDRRATGLLRTVVSCLGQKWMDAVRWPMEEIGMTTLV